MDIYMQDDDGTGFLVGRIGAEALSAVRAQFNPSGLDSVAIAKLLGAALINAAMDACDDGDSDARCASIAITDAESATMWLVKALTAKAP